MSLACPIVRLKSGWLIVESGKVNKATVVQILRAMYGLSKADAEEWYETGGW